MRSVFNKLFKKKQEEPKEVSQAIWHQQAIKQPSCSKCHDEAITEKVAEEFESTERPVESTTNSPIDKGKMDIVDYDITEYSKSDDNSENVKKIYHSYLKFLTTIGLPDSRAFSRLNASLWRCREYLAKIHNSIYNDDSKR